MFTSYGYRGSLTVLTAISSQTEERKERKRHGVSISIKIEVINMYKPPKVAEETR